MVGKTRKEAGSSSSVGGGGGGDSNRDESVVIDHGRRKGSCGYCKSGGRTSISYGVWALSLTVYDYQDLLDRGWRRSGCYLYKPDMEKTCCPSYTIRLKAGDYVPSKEQLRVSRRMQRFLEGKLDARNQKEACNTNGGPWSCSNGGMSTSQLKESAPAKENNWEEQLLLFLSGKLDNAVESCTRSGELPTNIQFPKASVRKVGQAKRKLLVQGSEILSYSSSIPFQIAAAIRRAQSAEKGAIHLSLPEHNAEENELLHYFSPETIAEKLSRSLSELKEGSNLSVRACKGHINFYSAQRQATSGEGLQIASATEGFLRTRGNKRSCLKKSPENPGSKSRRLEIRLKRSSFDPEEYALYRKYQIEVHNDSPDRVNEESYSRFLVDTPLLYVPSSDDGTVAFCGFGSFHQQYLIDGQLVAVGVIDILPKCLSSKYLFWDPNFASLSLGKYSAIQEIGWVKENQALCPSLQYYYLGYYIHSCRKMRYKAAYRPSELLCPLRYQWISYDIAKPLLDVKPYVVLSDSTLQDGESLLPHASEIITDQHQEELGQEEMKDALIDENEEMHDLDSEDSDDGMDPELSTDTTVDDISNVLIGLRQSRVRYKDLAENLLPPQKIYIESQLRSYVNAVGADLSGRMVNLFAS